MPTTNVGPTSPLELQQIADVLAKSRKIVVVTGAGISTNCGIPDFRSENGLYSLIQAQYDAALRDPPWESSNELDIDDRPKKKRRVTERWFYELVRTDGSKVEIPSDRPTEQPSEETSRQVSMRPETLCTAEPILQLHEPLQEEPSPAPLQASQRRRSRRLISMEPTSDTPELESESSNVGEKASEQLLRETSEYATKARVSDVTKTKESIARACDECRRRKIRCDASHQGTPKQNPTNLSSTPTSTQESSKNFRMLGEESVQPKTRRSIRSRSSLPSLEGQDGTKISLLAVESATPPLLPSKVQQLKLEESLVSENTIQISRISRATSRDACRQASVENPSASENSRASSRQSTRPKITRSQSGGLPTRDIPSSLRRSSTRIAVSGESLEDNSCSDKVVETPSSEDSSAASITNESNSSRNLSSELSSITANSEYDEPPSQSSQSSQSTTSRTLPNLKGKDLFDSVIWSDPFSTSIFYMFISSFRRKIYDDVTTTTPTHKFIRSLRDNGRLVRNYTQNIDCLEEREGLTTDLELGVGDRTRFQSKSQGRAGGGHTPNTTGVECVLLHGSLRKLRCGVCAKLSSWEEAGREDITKSGFAPDCPACVSSSLSRQDRGRRGLAVGRLRPDIVLYGEEHPNANLVGPLIIHDLKLGPDVLLIMGTSLRVFGLKRMVREFAQAVHAKGGSVIFVNQTKPSESTWGDVIDYWVEWDCDAWVLDLKKRRGDIWQPPGNGQDSKVDSTTTSSTSCKRSNDPNQRAKYRPQALREDKASGVYFTFKILDQLKTVKDADGNEAKRPIFWSTLERKPHRASTGQINRKPRPTQPRNSRKSLPQAQLKNSRKSLPPPRSSAKRRAPRSQPTTKEPEKDHNYGAGLIDSLWRGLRKTSNDPYLPHVRESVKGRMPLNALNANVPKNQIGYKRSFEEIGVDGGIIGNNFTTIRGFDIRGMDLTTLAPSGGLHPSLSPTDLCEFGRDTIEVIDNRPISSHAHGTRSKCGSEIPEEAQMAANMREDWMKIGAVCNGG